ncbi:hypothetical protein KM1_204870 [Entamoeba histolytica HM-3:IMSS]|uniref:Uncharacterized protein n=1 Tax=Entamoeba histolytica HM-3:IMSS TaxID=885315 RepID=M7WBL5_ENTHI|nr:hypothetical protein KM1_204870 [Entamoeba histolytica HM-3:IMSS]
MKEALTTWCSTKTNKENIKYLAYGKTTEGNNKHGYVFFILENQVDIMRKPFVNINGKEMKINFSPFTKLDAFDGSYLSIIDDIKNQSKKHKTKAVFEEYGNLKTTKGYKVGDSMIEQSLRMNSKAEAIAYLRNISPAWVMNNEKNSAKCMTNNIAEKEETE